VFFNHIKAPSRANTRHFSLEKTNFSKPHTGIMASSFKAVNEIPERHFILLSSFQVAVPFVPLH